MGPAMPAIASSAGAALWQLILMNRGWVPADAAVRTYVLSKPVPAGTPPAAEFLDYPERAAEALKDGHKHIRL